MYQTDLALRRRTHKVPVITQQIVVDEDLGAQVRDWRPMPIWKLYTRLLSSPLLARTAALPIRY